MSYEHDHITGNRLSYEQRNRTEAGQGGSTGLWLALGAVVLAIMLAISFWGRDGAGPEGLGGPATAPSAAQPDAMPAPSAVPAMPAPPATAPAE